MVVQMQLAAEHDRIQFVVPCWMLDESVCASMMVAEKPVIAITALLRLRELVDQSVITTSQDSEVSSPMMAKGDRHETRN